jgi:hypothetical protein
MKLHRVLVFVLAALVAAGSLAFSGCGLFSDENKEKAVKVINDVAEYAGEVTANWLGTTAANVGKIYNKSVVKRLEYLDIAVDKIDYKTKDGEKAYTIELSIDNTAPENEKLYVDILLDDHYLIACDKNDYVYSLSPYREMEEGEDEDAYYDEQYDYDNEIVPGKSRLTVYTTLPEAEEIDHLLFIEKNLNLPK